MRICIVQNLLPFHCTGGAAFLGWRTACGLRRRGHDVTVVTTSTDCHQGVQTVDDIRVVFLESVTPWCEDFHRAFARAAFDEYVRSHQTEFDIVQVRGWRTAGLAGMSCRVDRLGVPVTGHTSGLGFTYRFIDDARIAAAAINGGVVPRTRCLLRKRRAYLQYVFPMERAVRHLDAFSTVTTRALFIARVLYGMPRRCLHLINDGIPVAPFTPPLKEPEGDGLLFIGGLVKRKGVDLLLQALPRVLASVPDAALRIVGDGPELGHLTSLAQQLGVADRVVFAGLIDNTRIPDEIRAHRVFVNPSVSTVGYETVQIEAMLCGRVVVAPRTASNRMILENNRTGLFFRLGNSRSLADGIIIALRMDDATRESIAVEARKTALENFSVEKMGEMNEAVFVQVLRKHGEHRRRMLI